MKAEYFAAGNPVFSLDTKAKEHLGQLFRKGRVWTQQAFQAFDHDFPSWATGVVIPHGIYDLARNRGHINIGLSHDTSQFACDSFRWYWNRIGQRCYPDATSILLLCDCGGSNSATQYLFKQDLQDLVNDLGSKSAWRTTPATARSTTRSNAASFRMSLAPARECCSTPSTPWSA